jgi:hypothetical protein
VGASDSLRADDATRQGIPNLGSFGDVAMDANVVFDNSIAPGPAPTHVAGYQPSFGHKMAARAKKNQRAQRDRRELFDDLIE